MDYTTHFSTKSTPQTEKLPGRNDQVKNSENGYVFQPSDWNCLDRFLILGTQGGSYYANEKNLTIENSNKIISLIKQDGERVLNRLIEVSDNGLAPKNDPAIFTLALVCTFANPEIKQKAYSSITKVCRIGTHLFTFYQAIKNLRKSSSGLKRGIRKFYEDRNKEQLILQLIKYRQRNGWTHQDVIRLSHPRFPPGTESIAKKLFGKEDENVPEEWQAFEELQKTKDSNRAIELISKYKFPWEAVPTELHSEKKIWEAFLPHMGYSALLRNLSRFSKLGILSATGFDDATKFILKTFENIDALRKSRLHPLTILNGTRAYAIGRSERGHGDWVPSQSVIDILNQAFYSSFSNVIPANKNFLLALDVSGSMSHPTIAGTALSPRVASTALALVTMNTEPNTYLMGFSNRFMPLQISKKTRLQDACRYTESLPFESTDCSLPMEWAIQTKTSIDVFCVYTDSETYAGRRHPSQVLEDYRQKLGRDAKLVVVGMVSNGFTIADPTDPRQMDVVGFSLDTPQAISAFVGLN